MIRIAVSNLAWDAADHQAALAVLAAGGARGVEVAPTKIAEWDELTPVSLRQYRDGIEHEGLAVSSLQAIYFNRPDCQLLGDAAGFERMLEHMKRVAEIGARLGAAVAVFGAPGNRRRGDRPPAEAQELAVGRMASLADVAGAAGIAICIEPVPAPYGGDFLVSAREVQDLVAMVGHRHLRLHLDTGCVLLGGDDIAGAVREGREWLGHFHAAEPQLGSFEQPKADHAGAAGALHAIGYEGWLAIEMRAQPDDPLGAVRAAVDSVVNTYSSPVA